METMRCIRKIETTNIVISNLDQFLGKEVEIIILPIDKTDHDTLNKPVKSKKRHISKQSKKNTESDDPWTNPDKKLPCIDAGIEDLSFNHDHYLYGTPKLYETDIC